MKRPTQTPGPPWPSLSLARAFNARGHARPSSGTNAPRPSEDSSSTPIPTKIHFHSKSSRAPNSLTAVSPKSLYVGSAEIFKAESRRSSPRAPLKDTSTRSSHSGGSTRTIPSPPHTGFTSSTTFKSEEFDKTSKLSTKKRQKETPDLANVEVLVGGMLDDTTYFRTNRARIDTIQASLISAFSSERPGAIVESSCYRGSNECMTWGDHNFWVVPNPEKPLRPLYIDVLAARWLKGHRDDDSFQKFFFLIMEPDTHRPTVEAFQDQIFEDITHPEEIFFPKHPCLVAHKLRIKGALNQSVCRKKVYDGDNWVTSETLAMPYSMAAVYLQKISIFLGFLCTSCVSSWSKADELRGFQN
ncbi:hypothetical protein DFH09DRAFT_1305899 [Mycena vulgaris]|nr:hypothetical protein DFH09DRAFT_1305899 [Mycena vulgaris]